MEHGPHFFLECLDTGATSASQTRALPTVRRFSERNARGRLIRINPRDFQVDPWHHVGFEGSAVETLKQLDARLHG
jgi:hypothetical protein